MMKNIGNKIKEYREKAGISQKKLGLALGLSDKAVSAYESGRTLPPLETLYRIAQELKKPIKFLISEGGGESSTEERLDAVENTLKDALAELKKIRESLNS